MDDSRLLELLEKHRRGNCTDDELNELNTWYNSLGAERPDNQFDETGKGFILLTKKKLQELKERLGKAPIRKLPARRWITRIAAAAIIILLAGGAYLLFFNKNNPKQQIASNNQSTNDVAAPNSAKAFITLSNGSKVYLDSILNGTVAKEGNMTVSKQGDQVIYTGSELTTPDSRLNTLTVPKGSKPFKLLLADGSNVWLDAATTITYPTAFVGKERKVELNTGQAYFEITHNTAIPFKVKKGDAEIEVLGTHFNINAFDDEENMKVTLLEGSVKVNKGTNSVTIKPGEQAVLTHDSRLTTLNSVDLDAVMAWKNGLFNFNNSDLQKVLRELARWYDVSVVYEGSIPKRNFGGEMQRDLNLSEVLKILEKNNIHFRIEEKELIVTP